MPARLRSRARPSTATVAATACHREGAAPLGGAHDVVVGCTKEERESVREMESLWERE